MKRKRRWQILVLFLDLILLAYLSGSIYFSNILIDSDTQTLAEGEARRPSPEGELALPPPEPVQIDAGEVTLSGFFYVNEREGECAVMLLHGYTGTRYGALQYAPLFWDRGCDLLAYDARGHGASSDAYHTYGFYEKRDAQAAHRWLLDRTGLTAAQTGLTGVSYGAATSLQAVPALPDIAFVIADSPYQSMGEIVTHQAEEQFGWVGTIFAPGAFLASEIRAGFDVGSVSPVESVAETAVPILLIHALQDEFTPATHSEAIFANSNPAATELEITDWGAGHGMSIFADYQAYKRMVDAFLAEYAPGFGLQSGR